MNRKRSDRDAAEGCVLCKAGEGFSSNFANYSEDKIRASYEAVKDVQVRLALVKEKEFQSRRQRDRLEIRLRGMEQTLLMAERLATKLGTVVGYLTSQISNVVAQMDIASKNKFLGVQIIKAQEDERLRVSREIHDGPAQEMANLIYQASICERLVDTRPEEAKAGLQELRRQIRTCLADVRQIIFDMRPMSLDDLGLVPALRQLVSKLEERKILKTDFQVNGRCGACPPKRPEAMWRPIFRMAATSSSARKPRVFPSRFWKPTGTRASGSLCGRKPEA